MELCLVCLQPLIEPQQTFHEQLRRKVVAQVCDVSKPLMSVHRLVAAGGVARNR